MTNMNVIEFLEWKQSLRTVFFGKIMYNIEGYYKYLDESELWGYWNERVRVNNNK